jgi:hypothetical protein
MTEPEAREKTLKAAAHLVSAAELLNEVDPGIIYDDDMLRSCFVPRTDYGVIRQQLLQHITRLEQMALKPRIEPEVLVER